MFTKRLSSSLRFKLSLFIILLMVVSLGVFSVVFVLSEKNNAEADIRSEAKVFAESTAGLIYSDFATLYTHPVESDFEIFKSRVSERISLNPDIQKVSLVSVNGNILFDSDEFTSGKYQGPTRRVSGDDRLALIASDNTAVSSINIDGSMGNFELSVPIAEASGGHLLSVIYRVSNVSLSRRLNEIYGQIATTVIPLLLVSVALTLVVSNVIVRPLQSLTHAAQKLREGIFDVRIEVASGDEIGQLSQTFNDMTEKLKASYETLENERARLQASINNLPIGYVMTGPQNEILLINAAAERIFASIPRVTESESDMASPWPSKIDMNFIQQMVGPNIDVREKIETSRSEKTTIELKDISYNSKYHNFYISPIVTESDQHAIGSVLLIEDITERKSIERSREEFFSIASHELRTPLTAIRGNASLIQEYYKDQIKNPEIHEMIDDIHESSMRLIDIVNVFLDMSRVEQGKMEFKNEPFDAVKLSEEIMREYEVTGSRMNLKLSVSNPNDNVPIVYADKNKTRQIITNLVGNSLKFTTEGGINISFAKADNHLKILITDTGKGIPEANRGLLFRKFQQAQSDILTRDNTKGTGLGLYISKLMATSMGGDIVLEKTEVGKGSTFSMTIPIVTSYQLAHYTDAVRETGNVNTPHG